jgi:hypothetical protein
MIKMVLVPVLRIRDPVLFYVLDPGSGMNFSGSRILSTMTKTKSLLLKAYEARKKVSLNSTFHVGSGIRDEKMFGSVSGMRKWSDPDPG